MSFSARFLIRGATVLLLSIALFDSEFADANAIKMDASEEFSFVLGPPGATCTEACAGVNLECSFQSLEAGQAYYSASLITDTMSALGAECEHVLGDREGTPNPVIDGRNYCTGKSGSNFNCELASGMEGPGRRLCSCYPVGKITPAPQAPVTPQRPRPTPGPPLEYPTMSPTPGPTPEWAPTTDEMRRNVPPGFKLIWRDDFSGDKLDPDNWSKGLIYDRNPEDHVLWHPQHGGPHLLGPLYDGYILDGNTWVGDGAIHLRNRVEDPPIEGTWPTGTFPHSSGFANSLHKAYFNGSKRGQGIFVNLRAKFPSGNVGKVWSAIWMIPELPHWPPEIDLWEYFGIFFNPDWGMDSMQYRIRYGWYGDENPNANALKVRIPNFQADYGGGWHTYGFLWTWHQMKWFIDGVEVGRLENGVEIDYWEWPDEDMAFVLQNALMESVSPNDPAMPTEFPNTLSIDWMCVYERQL